MIAQMVQLANERGIFPIGRRLVAATSGEHRVALEALQAALGVDPAAAVVGATLRVLDLEEQRAARVTAQDAVGLRVPVEPGGPLDQVDVVCGTPRMDNETAPKRGASGWTEYVEGIINAGDDTRLIELATEQAGGQQQQLAALSGLAEETLSRVKRGSRRRGFSPVTRAWFLAYLTGETPPAPMERSAGPKARAGVVAPQVWVPALLKRSFDARANQLGGRRAVLDWLLRNYLALHPRGPLPAPGPVPTTGTLRAIRSRIAPELLAAFDARAGGPGARAAQMHAAIAAGIPLLRNRDTLPELPTVRARRAAA